MSYDRSAEGDRGAGLPHCVAMAYPSQPPPPGSPYDQPTEVQPPTPYKASRRSRVVVWTIAVVLVGTLAGMLGYALFGVARDRARDDKVLGACHQEARTRIGKGAGEANFRQERVSQPAADEADAFGIMEFRGDRQDYTCVTYLIEGRWTVREFRFGN